MRIAYLDCFSGISGDMFLGAAVDAGVSLEKLERSTAVLGLNTTLTARRLNRGGIGATKVDVFINGRADTPLDLDAAHEITPTHSHVHSHAEHAHAEHAHTHDDGHSNPAHEAGHTNHVHRGLKEIRGIIARAPISAFAQSFAIAAFELLAEAEAAIHNLDPVTIHFHEVGSEDAIVDIVCAAIAVEAIAADEWYCSALNVGGGTVRCAHGLLPVPAPATAELLRGMPIFSSGIQKELITPTGAAILRALKVRFEPMPRVIIGSTGYGAGAREIPGIPNLLRLMLGETSTVTQTAPAQLLEPSADEADTVVILEANIDDMNPQLFSYVQQKLLDAGALDAFGVPVQMKKGRPGIVFTVLAPPVLAEPLSRILLTETTTLGVRMRQEQRRILSREHVTVESAWGPIRVKLGRLHGEVVNCAPEFEDCRKLAEATGVPLKTILQEAMRLYLASSASGNCAAPGKANCTDASKSFSS